MAAHDGRGLLEPAQLLPRTLPSLLRAAWLHTTSASLGSTRAMDELTKIPPVTRAMLGLVGLVTLTPLAMLSDLRTWYLDWHIVQSRHQYWRLMTSFFYAGKGIPMLMSVFLLFRNSSDLENGRFFRRSSQYAWCLLVSGAAILALNAPLESPFLFAPLLTLLIYLWARDNPTGQVNLFGFITIPSKYLPGAYLFLDLVSGGLGSLVTSSTGLLTGHAWLLLEALGDRGDAPGGLGVRLARFLTQAPRLLRRILPDSTDPSTGSPTPTGGPGRRAAYGSAYAPRGGAWREGGRSLTSPGGGNSAAQGSSRFVPSFLRNLRGGGGGPVAGPSREDLLAAAERRLRAQAGGSIVGRNQARAASRASLATAQPSTAAQSTVTPTPRGTASGVHSIRQLQKEDENDLHTASSSGGSVAEQRKGHARQPSDPDAGPTEHWPGQGQRLGE